MEVSAINTFTENDELNKTESIEKNKVHIFSLLNLPLIFVEFLNRFNFKYEFLSATKAYKSGLFNDALKAAAKVMLCFKLPNLFQSFSCLFSQPRAPSLIIPLPVESGCKEKG